MATHEPNGPSLETLGFDILNYICQLLYDAPWYENDMNEEGPLEALSKTSRMLREISSPTLFKVVCVRANAVKALKMLLSLKSLPFVTQYIKAFKLVINVSLEERPESLYPLLVELLQNMHGLTKVLLDISEIEAFRLKEAFDLADVVLPLVETIIVRPHCDFVVERCPNLSILLINSWNWRSSIQPEMRHEEAMRLINAATKAEKFVRLEMTESWTLERLELVQQNSSKIQYFSMGVTTYQASITELLPLLSKMRSLHTLAIAGVSHLKVGFKKRTSRKIYKRENAQQREMLARIRRQREDAENMVADMVCKAFGPYLKVLWIGNQARFEISHSAKGVFERWVRHNDTREAIAADWVY